MFEFFKFTQELNEKRAYAKTLISSMKLPVFLAWASFAKTLKVGACDELCALVLTSEKIKGLYALRIILSGEIKFGGGSDDHVVLAFSNKEHPLSEIQTIGRSHFGDFLKTFHDLKDFVIVDPYLNKVIPSSELLSDETYQKQLSCMKNTRLKTIFQMTDALKSTKETDALLKTFETTLLAKEFPDLPPPISILPILIKKRSELIQTKLSHLYPCLTWKCHEEKVFWTRGEESILVSLQKELVDLGLSVNLNKIKESPEFCLRIMCSSYRALETTCFALSAKA